jgi:predicted porin
MNKKLMALAVAGAVTAPGFALAQVPTTLTPQPGVASNAGITLYGRVDETIMINQYKGAASTAVADVKKSDVYSPGNAMGVKGREDLGGGTAAWFQLEIGVWPSERLDTATTTGNNWGGRNSGIGISSGIGDIMIGVWDTPYKQVDFVWNSINSGGFSPGGVIMNNGDTTGALNNPLCGATVNNGTGAISTIPVCATEVTAGNFSFSRRISNSVQYWSPVMGGFQVKLMTALANYQSPANAMPNGLIKPKEYSANATWARGPLSLGIGYDYHEGLRGSTAVGAEPNPKDNAIQVAGKWNFGRGEIGAGYEQITYGKTNSTGTTTGEMKVPAYVVNGRLNVGPGALWASYAAADAKSCSTPTTTVGAAACGVKPKEYSLGYDYILSKRTKLYVAYNKIDNGQTTSGGTTIASGYYYIAGPAANAGNGTAGGLSPGTDVTTFGLGVQHVF